MISRFSDILQKTINISCNGKTLRKGRLLMLQQKDFMINLVLKVKGQTKKYDLPYPFGIIRKKGHIVFDYSAGTLCSENRDRMDHVDVVSAMFKADDICPNKFFNNQVIIEYK